MTTTKDPVNSDLDAVKQAEWREAERAAELKSRATEIRARLEKFAAA